MATMALIQAQVEPDVARRAAEILKRAGMSMEEAVQEMLARTVEEGSFPFARASNPEAGYDEWFAGEAERALREPGVMLSTEEFEARLAADRQAYLAERR